MMETMILLNKTITIIKQKNRSLKKGTMIIKRAKINKKALFP